MDKEPAGRVIDFRPNDAPRWVPVKRDEVRCKHKGTIKVCEQSRTIECGTCGCVLDPFDYFWELAKEESILDNHINHLRNALRLKQVEYEELDRKVKGLRATHNKLRKTTPQTDGTLSADAH